MAKKNVGLRQQVKMGIITLDEAIEIAKDYNESIQEWLKRRKNAGIKHVTKKDKPKKKKRQRRKKGKKNALV